MRYTTFSLIALTSATLSLAGCGWIGSRQQSQQANNSCCPNCPCCQNGHRGVVANQDRPRQDGQDGQDRRRDGGDDRRRDRKDDDRRGDDDNRRDDDGNRRTEEREVRQVIIKGAGPGVHIPMGPGGSGRSGGAGRPGMPGVPGVFFGMDGDEDVMVDVQVEAEPAEFDIALEPGPRLGVAIAELDDDTRAKLGIEGSGIVVSDVHAGTAADEAGLEAGDVIVAMDGDAVGDLAAFVESIRGRQLGSEVEFKVYRSGADEPLSLTATLQAAQFGSAPYGTAMPFSMNLDGATMKALHEKLQGLDPALQAKVLEQVQAKMGGALAQAGIRGQHGMPAITVPGMPLPPKVSSSHQATCRAICIDGHLRIEVESDSDDEAVDVEISRDGDQVFEGEVDPDGDLSEVPDQFRARARELIGQIQRNRH